MLPKAVQRLVHLFTNLPSVGEKTAARFAIHLATRDLEIARTLGQALVEMAESVARCARCGNLAEAPGTSEPVCDICADTRRDGASLCVVARIQDLMSIERSHAFRGYYFVLGKLLSPLEGVGAEELPIPALVDRIKSPPGGAGPVEEVLLATPPSVDGEATALLLAHELEPLGVTLTRIASGVPHGGDLEFSDPVTVGRAITGRRGVG